MMQEWADMVESWTQGKSRTPILTPPATPLMLLEPVL
jgi:hypothetical protein